MSLMKHKYAILDVCQRLPPTVSVMNDFAQRLNVPQDKVRQITNDSTMQEERYYQVCNSNGVVRQLKQLVLV